jgi:CMP-N,N'-diacetyllegionaminic acid synthase
VIEGQRVLAVITARGGSKGIPRKNVRLAGGRPLIAWTVEAALSAHCVDRVILSTDDSEIADVARSFGCDVPFMRPDPLATDDARSIDVVLHALDSVGETFEWVVLLQPTSPMRVADDIDGAVRLCHDGGSDFCVGVTALEEPLAWVFSIERGNVLAGLGIDNISRRQDASPLVRLNGAVYVARTKALRVAKTFITPATLGYEMPRDRSIDIDDETDLQIADALLLRRAPC